MQFMHFIKLIDYKIPCTVNSYLANSFFPVSLLFFILFCCRNFPGSYIHTYNTYIPLIGIQSPDIHMCRVARFFLVQNTKMGKNVPNYHELYQLSIKYNKYCKIDQVTIKYTNIFHCKNLQKLPKFGFLV
jgi:hypothetical protein